MKGGSIVGCKTNYRGGGVMVDCDETKGSRFTMESGAIIGCVAKGHGGGVETQANAGNELHGAFIMNGGVIEHCVANEYGGICCSGSFTMNGGTIRYCRATEETDPAEQRGGVYLAGRGQNILNGTIISEDAVDMQYVFAPAPVTIGADADIRANMYLNGYTIALADGVTSKTIYGKITNGRYADGLVAVTYQVKGADYATQLVRSGSAATKPVDPTNSVGADFLGWYKADGTEWDFTQTVTENITLTAKFAAFTKTVTNWSELQDALANADVDVVQLAANGISPWGNVARTLYVERAVILDLNGHVLKGNSNSVFEIKNGGHLTVIDSNPTAEHKFWVNNDYSYGVWRWNNESGDKIAYGGIINGGYTINGGGVYVCGGGVFEMNAGAAIIGCASHSTIRSGGGVYVNGTFIMNGGTIRECVARGDGGGVASTGQFTMNDGTIENCAAGRSGGAVYHRSGAMLTLNGTITSDNSSTGQPVYVQSGAVVTVIIGADADIRTNMYLSNCAVHANGGTVRGDLFANWDIWFSVDEGVTNGTIFYGKLTGNCDYNIDGVTVSYKVNNEDYATQFLRSGGTATQPDTPTVPKGLTFDGWLKADGTRWDFTTAVTENAALMGWLYVPVTNESELTAALADDTVDVIRLTGDIDLTAWNPCAVNGYYVHVAITRKVTIDLNGHVLKGSGANSRVGVFEVSDGGDLTLIDSNPTAPHKFTLNADGLWVLDETNGTVTVKGGIITGGRTNGGGGVCVNDGGKLTMTAGSIVGCVSENVNGSGGGGGVRVHGTFTMTGGVIESCRANGDGGDALCLYGGTMNAGGGTVDGEVLIDYSSFTTRHGVIQGLAGSIGVTSFRRHVMPYEGNNYGRVNWGLYYGGLSLSDDAITGLTVTYMINGVEYAKQVLPSGTLATRPDDPTTPGYTFGGWNKADGTAWDYANDIVTEDITLYADLTPKTYTVTFDTAGGLDIATKTMTATYGKSLANMPVPRREGYVFMGWYDAMVGGKCYGDSHGNGACVYDQEGNVTLYAQWAEAPDCTVHFETDGGTMTAPDSVAHRQNTPIAKPEDPTKEGIFSADGIRMPPVRRHGILTSG